MSDPSSELGILCKHVVDRSCYSTTIILPNHESRPHDVTDHHLEVVMRHVMRSEFTTWTMSNDESTMNRNESI